MGVEGRKERAYKEEAAKEAARARGPKAVALPGATSLSNHPRPPHWRSPRVTAPPHLRGCGALRPGPRTRSARESAPGSPAGLTPRGDSHTVPLSSPLRCPHPFPMAAAAAATAAAKEQSHSVTEIHTEPSCAGGRGRGLGRLQGEWRGRGGGRRGPAGAGWRRGRRAWRPRPGPAAGVTYPARARGQFGRLLGGRGGSGPAVRAARALPNVNNPP